MTAISGRIARTTARLAAAVVIAAGLAAVPATITTANAVEPDGPHYQEPTVGQCRNYTWAAAAKASNTSPVIACSTAHTALTFKVGQLPSWLTWDATVDQIGNAVSKICKPAWEAAVGGTTLKRRMAVLPFYWFQPTMAQRDHGARWFRCDLATYGHSDLLPLPNKSPQLRDGLPYRLTRCLWGTENFYTACAQSHHHRATGGFTMTGTTYPGDAAVRRAALRRCPSLVSSRSYLYVGPDRESWRAGDRIVICYTQTTH